MSGGPMIGATFIAKPPTIIFHLGDELYNPQYVLGWLGGTTEEMETSGHRLHSPSGASAERPRKSLTINTQYRTTRLDVSANTHDVATPRCSSPSTTANYLFEILSRIALG
jgi:hypothetical protein